MGVSGFKIGSGECNNYPLIEFISKFKKPIILSTGMSTMNEIQSAISIFESEVILLHCTSEYPTSNENVNLNAMQTMREQTNKLIGFSDHTIGINVPLLAVKHGAVILEKHFTLNKEMEGPDHLVSASPSELKDMISKIRTRKFPKDDVVILGSGEKKPNQNEIENAKLVRKSIVAITDIKVGDKFNPDNIGVRRPGEGLHPKFFHKFGGRIAKRYIIKDEYLRLEDL